MKIELPSMERMSQTGSGLLRIIQNNDIPLMDLFIREGFQNSLDAACTNKKEPVKIDVIYDDFNVRGFANQLEGIEDDLLAKNVDSTKYLAIRDSNTTGLTGPMVDEDITTNDYGNLYSLVYGISKPKSTEGAGGSWGLGKTSFFKIGNGLVIYYSRIELSRYNYQSRLVVTLVEDEKSNSTILPRKKNQPSQGLAWWGEFHKPGRTKPITDERKIEEILGYFDFPLYTDEETGTAVIIPFVDEENLLKSHVRQQKSEESVSLEDLPYWYNEVESFLEKSIQRWYFPRLENPLYQGKYFELSINGEKFNKEDIEPIFKIMTDLYNVANPMGPNRSLKGSLFYPDLKYSKENITTHNFLENPSIGNLAYVKVDKKTLQETIPNNLPNAYLMTDSFNYSEGSNSPIIAYTRRPGMIVSYETEGIWLRGVEPTLPDEYILAIFVLNSPNRINKNQIADDKSIKTIEDYIRAGEKADHAEWGDIPEKLTSVVHVIRRITTNVSNKLSSKFNVKKVLYEGETKSILSGKYGQFLLPQSNFGKRATKKASKSKPSTISQRRAKPSFNVDSSNVEYTSDGIRMPFTIKSNKKSLVGFEIELLVVTEAGNIGAVSFEETGLDYPFELITANMELKYKNSTKLLNYNSSKEFSNDTASIHPLTTKNNAIFGFELRFFEPKEIDLDGVLTIDTYDKNIQLFVNCVFNELEDEDNE